MDIDYDRAAFPADAARESLRNQYDDLIALADVLGVALETGSAELWTEEQTLALHRVAGRVEAATGTLRRVARERAERRGVEHAIESGQRVAHGLRLVAQQQDGQ